jgi:hypothetical protein
VHDINNLERSGIPGVLVASSPFVDAAAAQAERLGFDAARVFVEHPIQDRTDDEMTAIANQAIAELTALLTAPAT